MTTTTERFVWSDLSTFDLALARRDYEALLDWSFSGDGRYDYASRGAIPVAAIFPMPQRFRAMAMPSFWMSYLHVRDLDQTVAVAEVQPGVRVELAPQTVDGLGRVALIRDPSGAGFMLYEGALIGTPYDGAGGIRLRYHHLPAVALVEAFYATLFGWSFQLIESTLPWRVYDVRHRDGSLVARIEEVPEGIRGEYRYWIPCFSVSSMIQGRAALAQGGGRVVAEFADGRALASDQQGAYFMMAAPTA